jgi:hypothetical protein
MRYADETAGHLLTAQLLAVDPGEPYHQPATDEVDEGIDKDAHGSPNGAVGELAGHCSTPLCS